MPRHAAGSGSAQILVAPLLLEHHNPGPLGMIDLSLLALPPRPRIKTLGAAAACEACQGVGRLGPLGSPASLVSEPAGSGKPPLAHCHPPFAMLLQDRRRKGTARFFFQPSVQRAHPRWRPFPLRSKTYPPRGADNNQTCLKPILCAKRASKGCLCCDLLLLEAMT